jgi:hypothetical protein
MGSLRALDEVVTSLGTMSDNVSPISEKHTSASVTKTMLRKREEVKYVY